MAAVAADSVPEAGACVDEARDADAMSGCDTSVESSTVSPASSAAVKSVSATPSSNYPVVWGDKPTNWVPALRLDREDKNLQDVVHVFCRLMVTTGSSKFMGTSTISPQDFALATKCVASVAGVGGVASQDATAGAAPGGLFDLGARRRTNPHAHTFLLHVLCAAVGDCSRNRVAAKGTNVDGLVDAWLEAACGRNRHVHVAGDC
jgi:hypothetical protein